MGGDERGYSKDLYFQDDRQGGGRISSIINKPWGWVENPSPEFPSTHPSIHPSILQILFNFKKKKTKKLALILSLI